jgi:hypothetical protein
VGATPARPVPLEIDARYALSNGVRVLIAEDEWRPDLEDVVFAARAPDDDPQVAQLVDASLARVAVAISTSTRRTRPCTSGTCTVQPFSSDLINPPNLRRLLEKALVLDYVQHRQCGRGSHRVAAEGAEDFRLLRSSSGYFSAGDHGCYRVAVTHRLAERDHVRTDAVAVETLGSVARVAVAGLDFVSYEQAACVVRLFEQRGELLGRREADGVAREGGVDESRPSGRSGAQAQPASRLDADTLGRGAATVGRVPPPVVGGPLLGREVRRAQS